jgi:autophagy-related protein 13
MTKYRELQIEDGPPPPLAIEIYLDLADLTKSQSLVILDEHGKRWDVADFLAQLPSNTRQSTKPQQLLLERWHFALDNPTPIGNGPLSETLPNIYKRCIPVVRSFFSTAMLLPAWKYFKRLSKAQAAHTANPSLKLKYRLISGRSDSSQDSLTSPLYPGQQNVTGKYTFGTISTPAGKLKASVVYRTNCEFRVDDSEALLSSHFMGMDDIYFKPSLGRHDNQVVGSAPATKKGVTERVDEDEDGPDRSQTYGSLSTFHGGGTKMSSSPMTALRNISQADQSSPGNTPAQKATPNPNTQSTRPQDARRISISFQPFKAGSLASSPGRNPPLSPGRQPIQSITHRPRHSLNTLPQAILRTPNISSETAVASSTSSSPRPAPITKYSSSFSHRRSRLSSGASRGDDEPVGTGNSSRGSPAESGQQQQEDGSTPKTDDDSLQDFLKFIEQKKDLSLSGRETATQAGMRTTAALARYRGMKETARELSDSLSSSLAMKGTVASSSASSSRQIGALPAIPGPGHRPGDIGGMSLGSSLSPGGKPLPSPHAAHMPTVPSRLSANSVVDYETAEVAASSEPRRSRSRLRPDTTRRTEEAAQEEDDEDERDPKSIAIPTSPLPWSYGNRASSVRPTAAAAEDEDIEQDAFNLQTTISQSLPAAESSEQMSLLNDETASAEDSAQISSPRGEAESEDQLPVFAAPSDYPPRRGSPFTRVTGRPTRGSLPGRTSGVSPRAGTPAASDSRVPAAPSGEGEEYSPAGSSLLGQTSASGSVPGASSALASASAASSFRRSIHHRGNSSRGSGSVRGSHPHSSNPQDDDGELMFTMSELGSARRSLEDARTSSASGRASESRRRGGGTDRA